MICYRDRTYCASPNCENACGRKLTPEVEEAAKKADLPLSLGWFCGGAAEGSAEMKKDFARRARAGETENRD